MKRLACALWMTAAVAACGSPPPPKSAETPTSSVRDTRTELEKRRDDACEQLAPRLVACAVEDSRAQLAAGAITQQVFDLATKEDGQRALAADWRKRCRGGYMSSRQVRVLEVCHREETACAPLEACLENLKATAK